MPLPQLLIIIYFGLQNFDFRRHKLNYDGDLKWRVHKAKGDRQKSEHQDILLVLLEDMVVLLLKVDDRYVLKMHNVSSGRAERMIAKPIIRLNTLHATRVAAGMKCLIRNGTLCCNTCHDFNFANFGYR